MTKQFVKRFTRNLNVLAAVCLLSVSASAQYNPPVAYEDSYPVGPGIGLTSHTSAYSVQNVNVPMYGPADLVLAGWDDISPAQPAGVSWRLMVSNTPSAIYNQGVIPYSNVRDLEVGFLDAGGDPEILVAYYQNGVGHMLDVYSLISGSPVLLYTNVLSTMSSYTRISMDCHLTYGVAIAWQGASGINTVVGNNTNPITFSGVLTLMGTVGETTADCAFSHAGPLSIQCVYFNPTTGNITESAFDYWSSIPLPSGSVISPTFHDKNFVGKCGGGTGGGGNDPKAPAGPPAPTKSCVYMNIDCPGHYGVENWAYTYTTNSNDISVRVMDLNTSPFASTVVVNNGSIPGTMAINTNFNVNPFCAYDKTCGPTGITVGWFTNAPDPMTGAQAGYIGLRMNENGTALFSAPSYLTVANNPTWASATPVLSMSKQDDIFQSLYTVFPEFDPGAGVYQMENKYPPFCSNSFRGGAAQNYVCNDAANQAAFNKAHNISSANITAFPNPFTSSFVLAIPAGMQQGDADVVVTSLLGVVSGRYSGPTVKANMYLNALSKDLTPGAYLLSIHIKGEMAQTLKLVKVE